MKNVILNEIVKYTVEQLKQALKLLVKKIYIAATGSCYITIRTQQGNQKIRIADHKAGKPRGKNLLEIRADRKEYHGGKIIPCCELHLALEKIYATI